jgi:hypothetical protein
VAGDRQSFGEKICDVAESRHEDDAEVSLPHMVPQPMEAHAKRRKFEIDGVGCETNGDFIVAKYRCWGLGVPHVGQNLTFIRGDSGGCEETGVLGLCHKGADDRDTRGVGGNGVGGNGVVEWGMVVGVTHEVVTAGYTAGSGSGEVGRVGNRAKNHFRGANNFAPVGVGGSVAEQLV